MGFFSKGRALHIKGLLTFGLPHLVTSIESVEFIKLGVLHLDTLPTSNWNCCASFFPFSHFLLTPPSSLSPSRSHCSSREEWKRTEWKQETDWHLPDRGWPGAGEGEGAGEGAGAGDGAEEGAGAPCPPLFQCLHPNSQLHHDPGAGGECQDCSGKSSLLAGCQDGHGAEHWGGALVIKQLFVIRQSLGIRRSLVIRKSLVMKQ